MSRSKKETEENTVAILEKRDGESGITELSDRIPAGNENGKEMGSVMYLGPTLTGIVRHGTVFKDGVLPEKAKECIKEFPLMERLFVPVHKMPEAVKEIRKKQGALGVVYEQTAQKFIRRI